MSEIPLLRIPYEPFEAGRFQFVGRYKAGQFMGFVTGAVPVGHEYPGPNDDWRSLKRWVAVLHLFDPQGQHTRTEARVGGLESGGRHVACDRAWALLNEMLSKLESCENRDIHVRPFRVEVEGVMYALVHERESDETGVDEHIMLWPNDIMFHPPWDSGEYST